MIQDWLYPGQGLGSFKLISQGRNGHRLIGILDVKYVGIVMERRKKRIWGQEETRTLVTEGISGQHSPCCLSSPWCCLQHCYKSIACYRKCISNAPKQREVLAHNIETWRDVRARFDPEARGASGIHLRFLRYSGLCPAPHICALPRLMSSLPCVFMPCCSDITAWCSHLKF